MYSLANVVEHRFLGPEDVYVLDLQRTAAGLVAISSDQHLSLFGPGRIENGPISSWRTQHGNLTTLSLFDAQESVVCTAGEDGTVAANAPILSLACSPSTKTIAVGTELQDGAALLHLWDVRSVPAPKAQYQDLHSDDITKLAFHPSEPAVLLSGSTDGLVNIYDTRVADEDEMTVQTFNHNASIHHAEFLTSTEVMALSHDEHFSLYDVAEERENGDALQVFGDLRTMLGCQYVASVAMKSDGRGAVVGCGSQEY
ncbi:hypothetical protein E4U58_000123, partial [Claviceps cyperi]